MIPRQYIGGFDLESGTKVYLRCEVTLLLSSGIPTIDLLTHAHSSSGAADVFWRRFSADVSQTVHCTCRAYGRFNLSLWDDSMAEFQPFTEDDVIVVNFGAWYPRYNMHEPG